MRTNNEQPVETPQLNELPVELIYLICFNLEITDVVTLSTVSKYLNDCTKTHLDSRRINQLGIQYKDDFPSQKLQLLKALYKLEQAHPNETFHNFIPIVSEKIESCVKEYIENLSHYDFLAIFYLNSTHPLHNKEKSRHYCQLAKNEGSAFSCLLWGELDQTTGETQEIEKSIDMERLNELADQNDQPALIALTKLHLLEQNIEELKKRNDQLVAMGNTNFNELTEKTIRNAERKAARRRA